MAFLKDSVKTVHNAASMMKDTTSSLNARVCTLESNQVFPVPVNTHKAIVVCCKLIFDQITYKSTK